MKRLILFLMLMMPMAAMAQKEDDIKQLIATYSTKSDCTTIELSKEMLRSMGAGNGVDKLSVISVEDTLLIADFEKQVEEITTTLNTVMSVSYEGKHVRIYGYTPKGGSTTTEMIIFTIDNESAVMVWVSGSDVQLSNMTDIIQL
jgi:hypothetical protein